MRPITTESDLQQYYTNMGKVRGVNGKVAPFVVTSFAFQLSLIGQMISGKNRVRVRRDGHHYPEKQFVNWRAKAHVQLLEQPRPIETIEYPIKLSCWYWPSDERTRDVTGMLDALFYLLVYAKVIKNDGLIWDCSWKRYPKTKFPKVVMELESYV